MREFVVLSTFLLLSAACFSQDNRCQDGYMLFNQNNDHYHLSIYGHIMPGNSLNGLLSIDFVNDKVDIQDETENVLTLFHLEDSTYATIRFEIIKTKASLSLCVEEYNSKLESFFQDNLAEVSFNSTKEIPFLTFTRIE